MDLRKTQGTGELNHAAPPRREKTSTQAHHRPTRPGLPDAHTQTLHARTEKCTGRAYTFSSPTRQAERHIRRQCGAPAPAPYCHHAQARHVDRRIGRNIEVQYEDCNLSRPRLCLTLTLPTRQPGQGPTRTQTRKPQSPAHGEDLPPPNRTRRHHPNTGSPQNHSTGTPRHQETPAPPYQEPDNLPHTGPTGLPTHRPTTPQLPRTSRPTAQDFPAPELIHIPTPTLLHIQQPALLHMPAPRLFHPPAPTLLHTEAPALPHTKAPTLFHMLTPALRHPSEPTMLHIPTPALLYTRTPTHHYTRHPRHLGVTVP